jgi:hypothetical protein
LHDLLLTPTPILPHDLIMIMPSKNVSSIMAVVTLFPFVYSTSFVSFCF